MKKNINIIIFFSIIFISVIIIKINYIEHQSIENSTFQDSTTILERLTKLSKEDKKINTIIENYDDYPEEILNILSRNIETLEFVLNYPEKKGKIYNDNIGNVTKGDYYFNGIKDGTMVNMEIVQ